MTFKYTLGCGVAAAAVVLALPASAQDRTFDIPAQDMTSALSVFGRQSGLQVVAPADMLGGVRSPTIAGRMDARVALRQLIQGAGLEIVSDSGGVVVLRRAGFQSAAETEAALLDEVVVTGYANSLTASLNDKRRANNVVDSVRAEDIGKFPALNIAEALQRLPGVSIVRDRGEGVFVRVRGLGSNFQNVTLNGRMAAVNENVRDSGQSGRQFRFDTLPAELMSEVEIIKSPNAALDEGGIGGTVNLKTLRPLDIGRPMFAASATASYAELADKVDPRLSGVGSWVSDDGVFGALLAAVYDERSTRQDRVTEVGWQETSIDTNGDGVADSGTILAPSSTRPTLEREERDRLGVNAALQWKPNDRFELNIDGLWSRLNVHYDETTYSTDFNYAGIVPGTAVIEDGVLIAATTRTSTQIGRETSHLRYTNWLLGSNAKYEGSDWTLTGDFSYGKAVSDTPTPIYRARVLGSVGNVSFDYGKAGDSLPNLTFATADLNNPSLLPGRRLEYRVNDATDDVSSARADYEKRFDGSLINRLSVGVKYDERSRDYNRRDINFTSGISGVTFDSSFYASFPVDDFLDGVSGNLPRSWLLPLKERFLDVANNVETLLAADLTRSDKRNSYEISEEIASAYVMGDFDFSVGGVDFRGDGGLRYSTTSQTSSGHADNGSAAIPVSYTRDYDEWLPAFNLVASFRPDLQLHAAASKVITRPSLSDLAPRLTVNSNPTILTATGGNPELEPFEAWQYDASLEWYFAPGSALIAAAFYKDINTFVFSQTTPLVVDGQTYRLTAPVNGGNADVVGIELAYQQLFKMLPAPWDGLGAMANYTHTESNATYADGAGGTFEDDLTDVAKDSFNVAAFYEKGPAGVRLSYSWRGHVLRDVGGAGLSAKNDLAFGSLDFDMSWKLNDNLTAVVQGMNLTHEVQWQYVRDDRFAGYTDYGRTFLIGLRGRF